MPFPVIFDMETSDPDDVAALCFLCHHSEIDLKAVTVTPGTMDQIGLVKSFLERCHKNIPVGSRKPDHPKDCVSGFFRKHFEFKPAKPDGIGWEIMADFFRSEKHGILFTGAPLGNPRALLENTTDVEIPRWVCQGGFAGDAVVPEEFRLAKFSGKNTCPTFNFNGDRQGAELMLSSPRVKIRELISKNVCHGIVYDKAMHEEMSGVTFWRYPDVESGIKAWLSDQTHEEGGAIRVGKAAFSVFLDLMGKYLEGHPDGKMFHDPLAATAIVSGTVCGFEEVEVYRDAGGWGSRKKPGSNTRISICANKDKFMEVLAGLL